MGDSIAFQYGGSAAHNKMKHTTRAGIVYFLSLVPLPCSEIFSNETLSLSKAGETYGGKQKRSELITSIRRYYSNSFSDGPKQDGYNLFLGLFRPFDRKEDDCHIWELDNDYFLHNKMVLRGPPKVSYLHAFQDTW